MTGKRAQKQAAKAVRARETPELGAAIGLLYELDAASTP
jgi:hypothetical protein